MAIVLYDLAGGDPDLRFSPRCWRIRLALARDEAFCFYYTDNLELLERAGAELVPFSPIDEPLPENIDGIYLGGGYPELHAEKLAANASTREAIREFASAGGPIYAECGGLMYLGDAIRTLDGTTHPMLGLVAGTAVMHERLQSLGYVEVETQRRTLKDSAHWYSEVIKTNGAML